MLHASGPRLYHVGVHRVVEQILSHIRQQELLTAGDRVGVAVSGGIDSVALLRVLLELKSELGMVLSVVHFNHRLRGAESEADEKFAADLASAHGLEFFSDADDVAALAREEGISLETAARELRYGFFRHLLGEDASHPPQGTSRSSNPASKEPSEPWLTKICTGHTLDDQAETVIMRMIRGAGLKGLGGIHPRILVEDLDGEVSGQIVRPLLGTRRRELLQYLRDLGQFWREDSTNADPSFTRNRVRQQVLPLLETEFNPAVAQNLSELAEIARGEEEYWENEAAGWMGTAVHWSEPDWIPQAPEPSSLVQIDAVRLAQPRGEPTTTELQFRIDSSPWLVMNASLSSLWFLAEPVAVQRRVVKAIGEQAGIPLEFKHVEEILRFAEQSGEPGKRLSLPLGWTVSRTADELLFETPDLRGDTGTENYEYILTVPGSVFVRETNSQFEAELVPAEQQAGYNPDHLLDADSVRGPLRVRNWRPGDRYWPSHTKSPKKIKELLQERHIPQPERRLWPTLAGPQAIFWLRGFHVPAQYRARPGRNALCFREHFASTPRMG